MSNKVRFEIPFNIFCNICKNRISKGKRFNAKKSKINFNNITIYKFSIKCTSCNNFIKFKTNPFEGIYEIESGCFNSNNINKIQSDDIENIELLKNQSIILSTTSVDVILQAYKENKTIQEINRENFIKQFNKKL